MFMFMSSQIQTIIQFFLRKNICIAHDCAWDQVLASQGKGSESWGPYVEEWQGPPQIGTNPQMSWEKWATSSIGQMIIRRGMFYSHVSSASSDLMNLVSVLVLPLSLYPVVGLVITSGIKAIATAQSLHKPYFQSKKIDSSWKLQCSWRSRSLKFSSPSLPSSMTWWELF